MNQILLTLGTLTLGGSAAVLLLAWMGRSTRGRYGARWRCWGWLLLCLRLAVLFPLLPHFQTSAPIQVDIPPSPVTQPSVNQPSVNQPPVSPAPPVTPNPGNTSAPPESNQGNSSQPAPSPQPPKREIDPARIVLAVWLLGAGTVLAWNAAAHIRFLSYLHRWSAPVADGEAISAFNRLGDQLNLNRRPRLLVCQGLKVPMLAGIFRPAILLPQGNISGEALGFSLLHELTHYRRGDIWLKTLAMWVNALYWFNPLMWYMIRLVERDTELACDEDALRRLSPQDYSGYGQTILAAVARLQNRKENTHEE